MLTYTDLCEGEGAEEFVSDAVRRYCKGSYTTNTLWTITEATSSDDVAPGGTTTAYVTNKANGRRGPAQTVIFSKAVDGTYYIVEAVPDTAKKTVYVVTAYMSNEKATGLSSVNAEALRQTSETAATHPVANGNTGTVLNMEKNSPQVTSETPQRANASSANVPENGGDVKGGTQENAVEQT